VQAKALYDADDGVIDARLTELGYVRIASIFTQYVLKA
jgi:hypothetical protein